jgi:hypothetical protein
VNEAGRFYTAQKKAIGTHLALRWKSQVRYVVPRTTAGRQACWEVFNPGPLLIPLCAMARFPQLLGAISCTEGAKIELMRDAIGGRAGLSCCRTGAAGPWSKDTILLLDRKNAKPLFLVKAGEGASVDCLLENEAKWLRRFGEDKTLAEHVPELVAHRSGNDFCFVAQRPLSGKREFNLGSVQMHFLKKLQKSSLQRMRFEDSSLYSTLSLRLADLNGLLTDAWVIRIEKAIRRIHAVLSGQPLLLVAAHQDFTPWNIRVEHNRAGVFDWEYAADEQLPLFDPLHFVLLPMALKRLPAVRMIQKMRETIEICQRWFGNELCYHEQAQALTYLTNVCTLYLWGARMEPGPHPVLDSYANVIDHICLI